MDELSIAIEKLQTGVPELVCLSSGSLVSHPIKIALLIIEKPPIILRFS